MNEFYVNVEDIVYTEDNDGKCRVTKDKIEELPWLTIVRCKNCQYCKHLKEIDKYYCERNFSRFETSPDGFCDKGAEV